MKRKKLLSLLLAIFLIVLPFSVIASPIHSPTWGFTLDLPDDYDYIDGDGRDRFSFRSHDGAVLDLVVYSGRTSPYSSLETMAQDVQARLRGSGDHSFFDYRNKKAVIIELIFTLNNTQMSGWGLGIELNSSDANPLMLLALAYGPAWRQDLQVLHLSVLDSIAPAIEDRLFPGPITEFSYPRRNRVLMPIWGLGANAWFFTEDEEAAQALIEREFAILRRYADSPMWKEAWIRYYHAIYRDSYDRLANVAFIIERAFNVPALEERDFASTILEWIQSFTYERSFEDSDFLNLVSAVLDGRGDCDNLSMLMAIILNKANIPAAIMVSRDYSHAMALADLDGIGARFEIGGIRWLVAETTANVPIGLIAADMSDPQGWIGIIFPF